MKNAVFPLCVHITESVERRHTESINLSLVMTIGFEAMLDRNILMSPAFLFETTGKWGRGEYS
jgi:hypothetical protein